ncbi:hypothetical protein OS493_012546 [Desmophyllum pertusum]|uniref:SCP domain-containing protein n=1 Tax=Desmophyllum pertusum TaxID=174260 RepID=A0A9X0D006_9CNID|nr:hypothetical protein OS493_012546 [Desmophyllum pertusum]
MTFFRIVVFLTFCYMARADFREEALRLHNTYREIHDAPPMRLNRAMNRGADQYARSLFNSFVEPTTWNIQPRIPARDREKI